jgi:hypothetical protein
MPLLNTQNVNVTAPDMQQGPSIAKAGQAWDAVASFGNKMSNFGAELAQKRKQAETSSFVNTSANDLERHISEKETELQQKYAGDPTGYSAAMADAMDEFHETRKESSPNDDAKNIWEQKFSDYSTTIRNRADSWENASRAKYQIGQIDNSVYKDRQHLAQKPDPTKAAQFLTNASQMVNDGRALWFDDAEADKRLRAYGGDISNSLMEGMEANKQYGAALNVLSGKHPTSKILLANMEPDKIANYKDRFNRLMKAENEFNKTVFRKQLGDVSYDLQQGNKVTPEAIRGIQSNISQLDPEERAYAMDDLNHNLKYNELLQNVKSMDMKDATAIANFSIPRKEGDSFNVKGRVEMAENFKKKAQEILKMRTEQPAAFYAQSDKTLEIKSQMALDFQNPQAMKSWVDDIVSKQENDKNGADIKIMTPEMSKTFGAQIKGGNPELAENVIMSLKSSMKSGGADYYGNAVSDMIKNQDITPVQGLAMFMENPSQRADLMNATKNEKQIEESFKRFTTSDKSVKSMMNEIPADKEIQQIVKAIASGDPKGERLWVTSSLNNAMELAYKDAIVNKGLDPEQAKERALSVVKNNFSVAYSGRSSVLIPKQYENKRTAIEDFMDESLSSEKLKAMDIVPDASYEGTQDLIGVDPKEKYISDLAMSGKWVSNNSGNGAFLAKEQKDGTMAAVRDSKGNLVEVHFDKMRDNGYLLTDEMRKQQQIIDDLRDEAKTSGEAAVQVKFAQSRIAKLKREQGAGTKRSTAGRSF